MLHWKVFIALASAVIIASAVWAQEDKWIELNRETVKLYQQAKYAEAIKTAEKSVEIAENTFGPDHSNVAISVNLLAELYRFSGKYTDAELLYKRALAIIEKALGPDHPDIAVSLNNLAEFYRDQGKYSEAEVLYKRSLPILVKALGADHPLVADTLSNFNQCKQMGKKKQDSECEECPQRIEPQKPNR